MCLKWKHYGVPGRQDGGAVVIGVACMLMILFYSATSYAGWSTQTSGTTNELYSVYCLDNSTCYAVGDSGEIRKTTDGGTNWNQLTSGTTETLLSVHCPVDATTCFAAGGNGLVIKTTDSGANWNSLTTGTSEWLFVVHCPSSTICYAAGMNGTIIKTSNSGAGWSSLTSNTTLQLEALYCPSTTTCYAAGSTGVLRKTTDGTAWSSEPSLSDYINAVYCLSTTNCHMACYNNATYTTTDGTNWNRQTLGSSNVLYGVHCPDASNCFMSGQLGEMQRSRDGGTTWYAEDSGVTNHMRSIHCPVTSDLCFSVGSSGQILQGVDTPPVQSNWSPAKSSTIITSSPTITFDLDEAGDCMWSLTDQTYASMTGDCTGDGTTSITCSPTGLVEGAEIVYIACKDLGTKEDDATSNEEIDYTVDITLPTQSGWAPAKSAVLATDSPTITFSLSETGDCKWSLSDLDYDSMANDCTGDGTTSISCTTTGLVEGAEFVYVACQDSAGNKDTVASNEHINYLIDVTSPSPPAYVYDGPGADIDLATSTTLLKANWAASTDTGTGVAKYWIGIGTSAGATDTLGWTDVGNVTATTTTGLSLTNGVTYYFTVKAEDSVGLQSTPVSSDGQTANGPISVSSADTTSTANSSARNIVRDSNGILYYAYHKTSGTQQIFVAKSTNDGDTWVDIGGAPIQDIVGYNQTNPSIAIDSNDNLHVVWQGTDASYSLTQVKYSKYDGATWSAWANIAPIAGYVQLTPVIVVDKTDRLHVVWAGVDAGNAFTQIKYSFFNGSVWSGWVNPALVAGFTQVYPDIAVDSQNNLHVAWQGSDATNTVFDQIKYSRFDGAWSAATNIAVIAGYSQGNVNIAVDKTDDLHLVWAGDDPSFANAQIKYCGYLSGAWSAWANIGTAPGYIQASPVIAADYENRLHVFWHGQDAGTSKMQIKYSQCNGGCASPASWSPWVNETASTVNNQRFPTVRWSRVGTNWGSLDWGWVDGNVLMFARDASFHMMDWTPPTAPATVNDGSGADVDTTFYATKYLANWSASTDIQSGIAFYEIAIGTSPGATDTLDWTNTGNVTATTVTGLSITNAATYCFTVRAINNSLIKGATSSSDCAVADTAPPTQLTHSPADSSVINTIAPEVSVLTDKNAFCRFSFADLSYGDMRGKCAGGGTTSHTCIPTGIHPTVNTFYIACSDAYGNAQDAVSNDALTYTVSLPGPGPDPADRNQVIRIGVYPGGEMSKLQVSGGYAFIADSGIVSIMDVSNPAAPQVAGFFDTSGSAKDIVLVGKYAYVADSNGGLAIFDISNPEDVAPLGSLALAGSATALDVAGNYAYVAATTAGLRIIDISNPTTPSETGFLDTASTAMDVVMRDGYAYVADFADGLRVIDVSDPSAPFEKGFYDTAGSARGVGISGDYAFVADSTNDLRVIDISDPASPNEVASYDPGTGNALDVYVDGNYAYLANYSAMKIVDISTPLAPSETGSFSNTILQSIFVKGNYAYLANATFGLSIVDISAPSTPSLSGSYVSPGNAQGIGVIGTNVFVANGNANLLVLDASDPTAPVELSTLATGGTTKGLFATGSFVYVADLSNMRVVDVSTPAAPSLSGSYNSPGSAVHIHASGIYAYLADSASGLRVVDVSTPTSPTETGFFDTSTFSYGVFYSSPFAYLADGSNGLRIIDVSTPASPSETGSYNTPGTAYDVHVLGNYAYVADNIAGLRIIDVSTPASPGETGFLDTAGGAQNVYVEGNYAYVVDGDYGLRVIDVSNPAAPFEAAYYDTPGTASDLDVKNGYIYVSDTTSGVWILCFDNTVPTKPATVNDGYAADADTATSSVQFPANWSVATDGESGIKGYWVGIGTSAGATDTFDWAWAGDVTATTVQNLSLTDGQTYYFSVKAQNGVDLIGPAMSSDGAMVEVPSGVATGAMTISTDSCDKRKIVRDSSGNIYFAYNKGTPSQIYVSVSTDDGASWIDMGGAPIQTIAAYDQQNVSLAIDSADNLHVIWDGTDSTNTIFNQMKYSKYNGSTWSAWENIQEISGYTQSEASLAIDSADNLHVVWRGQDSGNASAQIKYSMHNGTSWSAWTNIQAIAGYIQMYPTITIDSQDNIHVLWYGKDSANATYNQVKYSMYNGSTWSAWTNFQPMGTYFQTRLSAAVDSSDNLHVVWYGFDATYTGDQQVKYSMYNGSTWTGYVNIQPIAGYTQICPAIAIDKSDNLHVMWYGPDPGSPAYYQVKYSKCASSCDSQANWSAWVNKTSSTTVNQNSPTLRWSRHNSNWGNLMWGWMNDTNLMFESDPGVIMPEWKPPVIVDNQAGDDTWRNSDPGPIFDVDFTDSGGSLLSSMQYTVWDRSSISEGTGTEIIAWTNIATSVNTMTYASQWGIDFSAATQGYNFVSIRATDNAGNTSAVATDTFYVKKDTIVPSFAGITAATDTMQGYSVSLSWSSASDMNSIKYNVYSATTSGGQNFASPPFATAVSSPAAVSGLTNDQRYYFVVRAGDAAGNEDSNTTQLFATPTCKSLISLTKATSSTEVPAAIGGSSPVPGARIEYVLTYSVSASYCHASDTVIVDPIPASMTYSTGTLLLDGSTKTDAADSDECEKLSAPNRIRCTIDNIASGATGSVKFKVTID